MPEQLAAFGIGEKTKQGFSHLWAYRPPIEDRIETLEKRALTR